MFLQILFLLGCHQEGDTTDSDFLHLFKSQQSDIQVSGSGKVIRILPDDLKGSRHQRFIIQAQPSLTLLIVHNIDIAPRINGIKTGDQITFAGEYIWNDKGGLIHWTHRDPNGRHPHGWIIHQAQKYW
nr:DUF3465 domain-containing protein [Gilvimarinus xylanilyticus]